MGYEGTPTTPALQRALDAVKQGRLGGGGRIHHRRAGRGL